MVAKSTQADRDQRFQDLANEVQEIKIIQRDVLTPNLKTAVTDIKTLLQSGFLTKAEADEKYATKDDVKFLKTLIYSLLTGFAIYIMGVATGLIGLPK